MKKEDLPEDKSAIRSRAGREVVIRAKTRVFDRHFKIDEMVFSHTKFDGSMSKEKSRLIFERGDSVACLIYNRDSHKVVLVEEFKAPTYEKGRMGGWMVETMAGTIRAHETPDEAVIREAMEETGYRITAPERICHFFSSPGGSSERIFVYFAVVTDADHTGKGGGMSREGEDIRIIHMPLDQLYARWDNGDIEDPKLLIALAHLRDRVKRQVDQVRSQPLFPSTILYRNKRSPGLRIGMKTGDIKFVKGVDLWVNSENTDMMMDRVIGRTISASIRYLGAERDDDGNVFEDTIANDLRRKIGRRGFVRLGTVVETESGALSEQGVKRILHVATVEGQGPMAGVKAHPGRVSECITRLLNYVEKRNSGFQLFSSAFQSILIPMLGAGDGGLTSAEVAPLIVDATAMFQADNPKSQLRDVYILAYTAHDRAAIEEAIAARQIYELEAGAA